MASYENLMTEQPWSFWPGFSDAWFSNAFTKETETLTKALQSSIAGDSPPGFSDAWFSNAFTKETETLTKALQSSIAGDSPDGDFIPAVLLEPLFSKPETTLVQTPTVSGVSENEAPIPKQRRIVPPSGRVAKRKSRAPRRAATTTFITADPANFMRMVQQVTGVRLGGGDGFNEQLPVASMLRPEPHRAVDHGLPTLDTSAFLIDGAASSLVSQPATVVVGGGGRAGEHYFDSFCSFPTLESWKAVE